MSRPISAEPIPADMLALRPRDAARVLSICERTLYQLTKDGVIPHLKIGTGKRKAVLYPVDALRRWLAERSTTSTQTEPHN